MYPTIAIFITSLMFITVFFFFPSLYRANGRQSVKEQYGAPIDFSNSEMKLQKQKFTSGLFLSINEAPEFSANKAVGCGLSISHIRKNH